MSARGLPVHRHQYRDWLIRPVFSQFRRRPRSSSWSSGGRKQWSNVVKKILLATAASAAFLASTPAFAQAAPVGPRVEAVIGYDKVKALGESDGGLLYGIGAGYDFAVAPTVSLGVDAEVSASTQKEGEAGASVEAGRDLYAGLRASLAVTPSANLFVQGG